MPFLASCRVILTTHPLPHFASVALPISSVGFSRARTGSLEGLRPGSWASATSEVVGALRASSLANEVLSGEMHLFLCRLGV